MPWYAEPSWPAQATWRRPQSSTVLRMRAGEGATVGDTVGGAVVGEIVAIVGLSVGLRVVGEPVGVAVVGLRDGQLASLQLPHVRRHAQVEVMPLAFLARQ